MFDQKKWTRFCPGQAKRAGAFAIGLAWVFSSALAQTPAQKSGSDAQADDLNVPFLFDYKPSEAKQREALGPLQRIQAATRNAPRAAPPPAPRKTVAPRPAAPPAAARTAALQPTRTTAAPPSTSALALPVVIPSNIVYSDASVTAAGKAQTTVELTAKDVPAPKDSKRTEPYNVVLRYSGETRVATLTWSADPPAALGYRIERRLVGGEWTQVAYVKEPQRIATDQIVNAAAVHEYRVVAFRSSGAAAGNPQFETITLNPASFAVAQIKEPYQVEARFDPQTRTATVSWQADAQSGSSYGVEMLQADRSWKQISYVREPVRGVAFGGLTPLGQYEFRVVSYRPRGSTSGYLQANTVKLNVSPPSVAYANVAPAPVTPVVAPVLVPSSTPVPATSQADIKNLTVTFLPEKKRATVSWTPESPVLVGYTIERRVPNGEWVTAGYVRPPQNSAVDASVDFGGAYEYRVTPHRKAGTPGTPPPPEVVAFTAPADVYEKVPREPYNVQVKYDRQTKIAVITWTADPMPKSSFDIEQRQADGQWKSIGFVRDPDRSFQIRNLVPGELYEFRIAAYRQFSATSKFPQVGSTLLATPAETTTAKQ